MINFSAIGTIGRDAEVKSIGDTQVINFTIAVNIGYGDRKTTQWVDCQKFGEKIGIAEYLKKGQKVYVSGTPKVQAYAKKDGTPAASLQLRVFEIELLGSKEQQTTEPQAAPVDESSDLPF